MNSKVLTLTLICVLLVSVKYSGVSGKILKNVGTFKLNLIKFDFSSKWLKFLTFDQIFKNIAEYFLFWFGLEISYFCMRQIELWYQSTTINAIISGKPQNRQLEHFLKLSLFEELYKTWTN